MQSTVALASNTIPENVKQPEAIESVQEQNFADNFELDPAYPKEDRDIISASLQQMSMDKETVEKVEKITGENNKKIFLQKNDRSSYFPTEEIDRTAKTPEEREKLYSYVINDNLGFVQLDLEAISYHLKKGGDKDNLEDYIKSDPRTVDGCIDTIMHELGGHLFQDDELGIWKDNDVYKDGEKPLKEGDLSESEVLFYEMDAVNSTNEFFVRIGKPELQRADYFSSISEGEYTYRKREQSRPKYDFKAEEAALDAKLAAMENEDNAPSETQPEKKWQETINEQRTSQNKDIGQSR